MTGKDCIAMAMTYVGLNDVKESYLSDNPDQNATDLAKKFCVFMQAVINEIAIGYVKLVDKANVNLDGEILEYSDIADRIYEVISVKCNGKKVYPQKTASGLLLPKGNYEITYAYLPLATETDELPFHVLVSDESIAYGIASQYFLTMGMAEEAQAFDDKFKLSLKTRKVGGNLKVYCW